MDKAVFYAVCVPLLGVKHTALLAISTPDDEFNFYSELFDLKNDEGELLFYLISIGLACTTCLENGLQCNHFISKLPHWKPMERQALINTILSSNPELSNRETRGVVVSNRRYLFDAQWVKALGERALYKFQYKPSVLFCAIDSAGGGSQSAFAIATIAYELGHHVIVGLDACNSHKHNNIVTMLEGHLRSLRKCAEYKNSMIYIFIEANYGGYWCTDIIKNVVNQKEFQPMCVVSYDETAKDRVGIWMTADVKQSMAGTMQRSMADGQMCFAHEFFTQTNPKTEKDIKSVFREQLSKYREELIVPLDVSTGVTRKVITGKSSSGMKDDLCIVVQISLYFSGKKRIEPAFRELALKHGWRY